MRVIILGSGTSQGIPIIGCKCRTCTSLNPKDKRLRVSAYIEIKEGELNAEKNLKLLIDTSSDFRQQMLSNNLDDVDVVLYTHHHIDHIMGLDDIRQINQLHKKAVDVYGNEETINYIRVSFRYIFDPNTYRGGGIPNIKTNVISLNKFTISGVEITPIWYFHGESKIFGYRIGDFAYMTDCSAIPDSEFVKLENLKVLVLDALRYKPHPTHFSIEQAIAAVNKIKPRQTYFIHMTHDILHDETNGQLPEGIQLAYDGLELNL
jgi:phosphoribosyl 1,2-cyclic phosphate phosphodiesterase